MLPKYPHSAMIAGQTGCGKTEFVLDLLSTPQNLGGYLHYFEHIVIICPTLWWNKAYQNRKWIWTDDEIYLCSLDSQSLHEAIEKYNNIFSGDETLFIVDDCSATKELKFRSHSTQDKCMISELAFSGRHAKHSCWILSQKYNSVLKDFREQLKWLCLFYCKDRDSFENCLKENDVIPDRKTRQKLNRMLKGVKHTKLILKMDQPTNYVVLQ